MPRSVFNVELTDAGDVYVNGNFVEQLCFDGESLGCALAYYYDHAEEFKNAANDSLDFFKNGDSVFDESNGTLYVVLSNKNDGGAYLCAESDELDDERGEYVNFSKPVWVSEYDLKKKAGITR